MDILFELENVLRQTTLQRDEVKEQIRILKEFSVYPELPIVITKIGIPMAVNIPMNERENLIRFLLVVWEREYNRAEYFIEKIEWQIIRERETQKNDC